MTFPRFSTFVLCAGAGLLWAGPADEAVFRSDVSLVRVDAQVLDRENRAITGLRAGDFILRDQGRAQPIRNFTSEAMPLDVLFLFDVSASMRPHVERIANAAHDAFRILDTRDRVAIMVFDRASRVRMNFRPREDAEREMDRMLRDENFRGGTDILRAMLDAADYIRRQGRKDARRAIVILTDDQTEFERDDARVGRALERADAVMSALIAPDAMNNGRYGQGGRYPGGGRSGGTWPGASGPLGGIIFGRPRGGYGNGRGMGGGGRTKSAGTSECAQASGGDSIPVDDASALETTLTRLRQRYALHFLVPPGARAGEERTIEVALSSTAQQRYPDAEVRFRRTYIAPDGGTPISGGPGVGSTEQPVVVEAPVNGNASAVQDDTPPTPRRRRAISEPDGPRGANANINDSTNPAGDTTPPQQQQPTPQLTSRPVDQPGSTAGPIKPAADADSKPGGWRKLKPGEVQQQQP